MKPVRINKMKINRPLLSLISVLLIALFTTQVAFAEKSYRVRSSDNLERIVKKFYSNTKFPKGQIMVGILAKNPRAFRDGNINFLLRGKRLKLPSKSEIRRISYKDAKLLLAQHAFFFREGVTGGELLLAPVVLKKSEVVEKNTDKKSPTESQDKTISSQQEQTKKISKLEQESEDLRKKLAQLFEEKEQRDQKLIELEDSLKNSINKQPAEENNPTDTISEVEDKNKKLEQTNAQLQQKLQESRSELAENTRSTITLEREINELQNKIQNDSNFSSEVETANQENSQVAFQDKNRGGTRPLENQQNSWGKLIWLLPLLLLGIWFLLKYFRENKGSDDDNIDYAGQIAAVETSDFLEQSSHTETDTEINYEEESLEASIKLDVSRAYVEAGDTESALNILREVMEEGSEVQRKEAQEILASLT